MGLQLAKDLEETIALLFGREEEKKTGYRRRSRGASLSVQQRSVGASESPERDPLSRSRGFSV